MPAPTLDLSSHTAEGLIGWAHDTALILIDLAKSIEASGVPVVPEPMRDEAERLVAACKDVWRANSILLSAAKKERETKAQAKDKSQ